MAGRKHYFKLSFRIGLERRNDLPVVLHLKRHIGQRLRRSLALSNGSSSNRADRNGPFDAARSGLGLGQTEQREKGKHESKEKSIHKTLMMYRA